MTIDEMIIVFCSGDMEEPGLYRMLMEQIEQLGKENGLDVKGFRKLFMEKLRVTSSEFSDCRFLEAFLTDESEMERAYGFLLPFIPYFPNLEINVLWDDTTKHDEPYYGHSDWSYSNWQDENEDEELPDTFYDLFDFEGADTATPYEWLVDWVQEHKEEDEKIEKWFVKQFAEFNEDYDEDSIYDNCKRFWQEFFGSFPEAWKEFVEYVYGL